MIDAGYFQCRGRHLHIAPWLLLLVLAGCATPNSPDGGTGGTVKNDSTLALRTAVLRDLVANVALPVVHDFESRASDLLTAVTALNQQRTEASLEAARQAWRSSRRPWEMCEAFFIGPARSLQIDPDVDSWPIDLITINSILASSDGLTAAYIDASEGTVKGSHTIEYLLWGENGNKTVGQITRREYEYLVAATETFHNDAARLATAWLPASEGGGDFGNQISTAGAPGSIYLTQASAVSELITSMSEILVEVSDAKMGIPYMQQGNAFEEARFSNNSLDDFRANLLGVKSLYLGTYGSAHGRGIRNLVAAADSSLDGIIQDAIEASLRQIDAIQPSFSEAVEHDRNSVLSARYGITELADLLSQDATRTILP